jgi:hypothetical protein
VNHVQCSKAGHSVFEEGTHHRAEENGAALHANARSTPVHQKCRPEVTPGEVRLMKWITKITLLIPGNTVAGAARKCSIRLNMR